MKPFKLIYYFIFLTFLFLDTPYLLTQENQDRDTKILEKIKETFYYGTYQEQADILQNYSKKKYPTNDNRYTQAIEILIKNKENSPIINFRLIEVISSLKLKNYYKYFETTLKKDDPLKKDRQTIALIEKTLKTMCDLTNKVYSDSFKNYFDDPKKNRENNSIIATCILGLGITKTLDYREKIKKLYLESSQESIKRNTIISISLYKQEEDISFFEEIINSEEEKEYYKWIAIIALKEYSPNKKAQKILIESTKSKNPKISSRAIYALNGFDKTLTYPIFVEGSKSDSVIVRTEAIKALSSFKDEQTNKLLKYKYKYDAEYRVREAAKKILIERKVISEEEKK